MLRVRIPLVALRIPMAMPKKPRRKCLNCQKKCKRPKDKYCNNSCQGQHRRKLTHQQIRKTGKATTNSQNKTVREFLIVERGHQCEVCKETEWCGNPIPLLLDHKDGNSDNGNIDNLQLVCGNCDMQLPTYKGRNRGNGRFSRAQRYRDGKSY